MHRQLSEILSQNPNFVQTYCIDGRNVFELAFRKWYLDNHLF